MKPPGPPLPGAAQRASPLARLLLAAGLAAALGLTACGPNTPDADAPAPRVSHETVERYRTAALLRLQEIDPEITALEARLAGADSAAAAALAPTVAAIRADRRALQTRLDALDARPEADFRRATQTIDRHIRALRDRLVQVRPAVPPAPPGAAARPDSLGR